MWFRLVFIGILSIFIVSCSSKNDLQADIITDSDWIVDELDVTGEFFLYPLALNPNFDSVQNINLADGELVGIVNFGNQVIVYPYVYTFENEVINSEFQGRKYAFTYCPITKSAIAFNRTGIFRASGYLYKNNLTPWDAETESIWSQMLIKGIKGDRKNNRFNTIPVLETTLGVVKSFFPNAKVLAGPPSLNNKSSLKYNSKPPDDTGNTDDDSGGNIPNNGEFVYGIIDDFDNVHIFKYSDFSNQMIVKIIRNQEYIIVGNQSKRFINAFKVSNANDFEVLENQLPYVIKNKNGVKYNILGVGSNGSTLEKPKYAYVAIWRAWEDFYSSFNFIDKE
ncbi:DUF3179 domain-containing (seleno)protein [Algibacter luteus]|uniref:DUF3179 domain-containing protein n=1 Tax=Algibacter luteus TaxID=1178825 RepID=A0A1M6FH46_9FLAO|nr:DUF3179 domain-containing (seleno)protein [Algibacter luteus]SHI96959.1 Protein of unknown function [Algibacter luteus]